MKNRDTGTAWGELIFRIRRIYASIKALHEFDMEKLPAHITLTDRHFVMVQDFSGGLSEEDIANLAHLSIHNIVSLRDHLKRWAAHNGKDPKKVEQTFEDSKDLKLLRDLANNENHGYPPRDGGHSGLAPKLSNIHRTMRLTASGGSSVVMTLGPNGAPRISGSGSGCAIITGDVTDKDGNRVGDLLAIEESAIQALEGLLEEFGIGLRNGDDDG